MTKPLSSAKPLSLASFLFVSSKFFTPYFTSSETGEVTCSQAFKIQWLSLPSQARAVSTLLATSLAFRNLQNEVKTLSIPNLV